MRSTLIPFVFIAVSLNSGCEPEESPSTALGECERLLEDGEFINAAVLAKDNKLYTFAIPLLNRLRAETDYWRGCTLVCALCELTGVDVPYGCSVPEADWPYWANRRLAYWEAWIGSREGLEFLSGKDAPSLRRFWGDDDLIHFLQSDAS